MRIIGGQFKGRKINFPDKKGVRPTKDRIREAVFNVIAGKVPGAKVLDLFAGSGSYGLEALSRGADTAIFVDKDRQCCNVINENLVSLGLERNNYIECDTVSRFIEKKNGKDFKFDLIFADPPYDKGLLKKALIMIYQYDILNPSGLLITEHGMCESLPDVKGNFSLFKQKTYKDIKISYFYENDQKSYLSWNI
jgi:16S rRNA (guanine(966)-N(2))-methyltransferase RsmD